MAFDAHLAERIRNEIGSLRGFSEKRMFGGVGFMLHNNMCCGISGDHLVLRIGLEDDSSAICF